MQTIEQYYEQCKAFFDKEEYSSEHVTQLFSKLTLEQKQSWYMETIQAYEKTNLNLVRTLVQKNEPRSVVASYRTQFDKAFIIEEFQCIKEMHSEQHEKARLFMEEQQLQVVLEDITYRAEKVIDVLWSGWECDSQAWIIKKDGQNVLVMSDHGRKYIAEPEELRLRIEAYKTAINESEQLLNMIGN